MRFAKAESSSMSTGYLPSVSTHRPCSSGLHSTCFLSHALPFQSLLYILSRNISCSASITVKFSVLSANPMFPQETHKQYLLPSLHLLHTASLLDTAAEARFAQWLGLTSLPLLLSYRALLAMESVCSQILRISSTTDAQREC